MAAVHPDHLFKLLVSELFASRRAVVGVFAFVTLTLVAVGLVWPKGYVASTTILVDEKNIIQPLMQGAAVSTEVSDRSRLARETIFGRKVMTQLLIDTGEMKQDTSPEEQDTLFKRLQKQTKITTVTKNVIKIEYRDDDPKRAFQTTKRYDHKCDQPISLRIQRCPLYFRQRFNDHGFVGRRFFSNFLRIDVFLNAAGCGVIWFHLPKRDRTSRGHN